MLRHFPLLACLMPLMACGASEAESVGSLSLQLSDTPSSYEKLDVELASASIHDAESDEDHGWVQIPLATATINVADVQRGKELPLGSTSVPAGNYDRIQIMVKKASVTSHGQVIPMGLGDAPARVEYAFRVAPFDQTEMLLDFDARASVVPSDTGDGSLRLDPHFTVRSERRK